MRDLETRPFTKEEVLEGTGSVTVTEDGVMLSVYLDYEWTEEEIEADWRGDIDQYSFNDLFFKFNGNELVQTGGKCGIDFIMPSDVKDMHILVWEFVELLRNISSQG